MSQLVAAAARSSSSRKRKEPEQTRSGTARSQKRPRVPDIDFSIKPNEELLVELAVLEQSAKTNAKGYETVKAQYDLHSKAVSADSMDNLLTQQHKQSLESDMHLARFKVDVLTRAVWHEANCTLRTGELFDLHREFVQTYEKCCWASRAQETHRRMLRLTPCHTNGCVMPAGLSCNTCPNEWCADCYYAHLVTGFGCAKSGSCCDGHHHHKISNGDGDVWEYEDLEWCDATQKQIDAAAACYSVAKMWHKEREGTDSEATESDDEVELEPVSALSSSNVPHLESTINNRRCRTTPMRSGTSGSTSSFGSLVTSE